jgi:hypothetical protein
MPLLAGTTRMFRATAGDKARARAAIVSQRRIIGWLIHAPIGGSAAGWPGHRSTAAACSSRRRTRTRKVLWWLVDGHDGDAVGTYRAGGGLGRHRDGGSSRIGRQSVPGPCVEATGDSRTSALNPSELAAHGVGVFAGPPGAGERGFTRNVCVLSSLRVTFCRACEHASRGASTARRPLCGASNFNPSTVVIAGTRWMTAACRRPQRAG